MKLPLSDVVCRWIFQSKCKNSPNAFKYGAKEADISVFLITKVKKNPQEIWAEYDKNPSAKEKIGRLDLEVSAINNLDLCVEQGYLERMRPQPSHCRITIPIQGEFKRVIEAEKRLDLLNISKFVPYGQ